jgi:hypothetical protein
MDEIELLKNAMNSDMSIEEMGEISLKILRHMEMDTPDVIQQIEEITALGRKMREEAKGLSKEVSKFKFHMEQKEQIDEAFAKLNQLTLEAFKKRHG